jgi:hypothetical protein
LTLAVEHPSNVRVRLAEKALALDDSWILLDTGGQWTAPDASDPTRSTTSWSWKVTSLEPGDRELPRVAIDYELDGNAKRLEASADPLSVKGVLAPEEDTQRPAKGFRPISIAEPKPRTWIAWAIGAAAVLALAYVAWRFARRRRKPREEAPSVAVRLAALETRPLDSPDDVAAAHYVVTSLLREALDRRSPKPRAGWTDEEWLSAARADLAACGLSEDDLRALGELLIRCDEVKYGAARPTHWAARETIARAREFAQKIEVREVAA